jgi:hypothetical protein
MSWENFDWLDFEFGEYKELLNHRVREAYLAAYAVLERAYQEGKEKLEQERKKATTEEDYSLTGQIIDYEESRWVEQTEALAAMALALLASLTRAFLDEQKRRMNKTHPPDPKGYMGKGLVKQVTEYKARFNIDLEKIEAFETVREVELARNCCLHNGGASTKDYETQTKQRLLDDMVNINLTPEQLDLLINELGQFMDSLSRQIREVRKKASETQSFSSPTPAS